MRSVLLIFFLLSGTFVSAQRTSTDTLSPRGFFSLFRSSELYAVNPLISIPLIAGGGIASQHRLLSLQNKSPIPESVIVGLSKDDIRGIDHIALTRNHDKHKQAVIQSDYFFNTGKFAPFALFLWKKYRRDWFDISLMYLEAQVTQGLFYGYAPFGPTIVDRYRPLTYYTETGPSTLTDGNNRNSMYSGHVSTMSTGFYFMARMIDDYNPQFTTGQRVLLYTGATIPSLYGGWLRIQGLKHFPTDVFIGLGVGAFSGLVIPSVHKYWKSRHGGSMTLRPVYGGGAGGFALTLRY